MDVLGYPFCRGRILYELEFDHGQYDDAMKVFWATGACLAVRMDAFYKAGSLAALHFVHMEEIDLCWRMQRAGYTVCRTGIYCFPSWRSHLKCDSPRKLT